MIGEACRWRNVEFVQEEERIPVVDHGANGANDTSSDAFTLFATEGRLYDFDKIASVVRHVVKDIRM